MKKILFLLLLIFSTTSVYAVEEISLEKESLSLDYISDVYYGKAENQEKISPFFKLFTKKGLEFEDSYINSIKISMMYSSHLNFFYQNNKSSYLQHDFNSIEPKITVNFNDNRSVFGYEMNLMRDLEGYSNDFTQKINRLYFAHKITDNQTIYIGQSSRHQSTFNGVLSTIDQEMVLKSQLGRTLGNVRSVGIRDVGKYKYLDYDIGIYDSTRYMKDFGQGLDFAGKILLKPFANVESDNLDFKFGAAYTVGEYYNSYNQYALYASYDNNKFHIKSEYANADGYNGTKNSKNKANGFYTTVSYDINPKFSLIGRYDYFCENKYVSDTKVQEYTAGITYKPFKNLKFMLNFVRRDFRNVSDSNMIMFATRFII